MLALFNVELRTWGSTVFLLLALALVLLVVTAWGMTFTILVGALILILLAVVVYYCGSWVDRKMRHGLRG